MPLAGHHFQAVSMTVDGFYRVVQKNLPPTRGEPFGIGQCYLAKIDDPGGGNMQGL